MPVSLCPIGVRASPDCPCCLQRMFTKPKVSGLTVLHAQEQVLSTCM